MENKSPKLSIITINLNNARGLKRTLESVACQTYTDYEHIIIDGGSTDESIETIKQYESQYNGTAYGLYWVSEPDKGIYNAMNKGIKVAKGEYCLFLNSGDWLVDQDSLEKASSHLRGYDIFYMDLRTIRKDYLYPNKLTLDFFFNESLGHPSTFIKTKLFSVVGNYSESNIIVSDWEFFLKAIILKQCSYKHVPIILSFFEDGGMCTNPDMKNVQLSEREKVLKELFPLIYNDYVAYNKQKNQLLQYSNSRLLNFIAKVSSKIRQNSKKQ